MIVLRKLEILLFLDVNNDVKIAVRAARTPASPLPRGTQREPSAIRPESFNLTRLGFRRALPRRTAGTVSR